MGELGLKPKFYKLRGLFLPPYPKERCLGFFNMAILLGIQESWCISYLRRLSSGIKAYCFRISSGPSYLSPSLARNKVGRAYSEEGLNWVLLLIVGSWFHIASECQTGAVDLLRPHLWCCTLSFSSHLDWSHDQSRSQGQSRFQERGINSASLGESDKSSLQNVWCGHLWRHSLPPKSPSNLQ